MPSFTELVGVIATFVSLSIATGHGDWVWREIAVAQSNALHAMGQDWGCPSAFNKSACRTYGPRRYR